MSVGCFSDRYHTSTFTRAAIQIAKKYINKGNRSNAQRSTCSGPPREMDHLAWLPDGPRQRTHADDAGDVSRTEDQQPLELHAPSVAEFAHQVGKGAGDQNHIKAVSTEIIAPSIRIN